MVPYTVTYEALHDKTILTPDLRSFCTKTLRKVVTLDENIFRGAECVALDVYMLVDIKFLFQFLLELILASIEREIFGFFQDRKHFREFTIGFPIVNSGKCLRS